MRGVAKLAYGFVDQCYVLCGKSLTAVSGKESAKKRVWESEGDMGF